MSFSKDRSLPEETTHPATSSDDRRGSGPVPLEPPQEPPSTLRSLAIGFVLSLVVVGAYAAWKGLPDDGEPRARAESAAPPEAQGPAPAPTQAPPASAAELPTQAPAAEASAPLAGEVLEVLEVTAYTYLRVGGAQGEFWAAVAKTSVQEGQQVTLTSPLLMRAFHSKELERDFELIYFANLQGTESLQP